MRLLLNKLAEIKLGKRANECDYRWQIKLNAASADEEKVRQTLAVGERVRERGEEGREENRAKAKETA